MVASFYTVSARKKNVDRFVIRYCLELVKARTTANFGKLGVLERVADRDIILRLDKHVFDCGKNDKMKNELWKVQKRLLDLAAMLNKGTRTLAEVYPAKGRPCPK